MIAILQQHAVALIFILVIGFAILVLAAPFLFPPSCRDEEEPEYEPDDRLLLPSPVDEDPDLLAWPAAWLLDEYDELEDE